LLAGSTEGFTTGLSAVQTMLFRRSAAVLPQGACVGFIEVAVPVTVESENLLPGLITANGFCGLL
jgi:hypothetical protein